MLLFAEPDGSEREGGLNMIELVLFETVYNIRYIG